MYKILISSLALMLIFSACSGGGGGASKGNNTPETNSTVPDTNATIPEPSTINTPTLTTTPISTSSETQSIEINGEKNSEVFINGTKVGTIDSSGKLVVNLDTSGKSDIKQFNIVLKKDSDESNTLSIEIEKVTRASAIKLLRQASFTSYEKDITYILDNGTKAWIETQLNTIGDDEDKNDEKFGYLESMTRFLNKVDSDKYPKKLFSDPFSDYPEDKESLRLTSFNRSIWWQKAFHNEDQLRQRVAYALSQLLVVGKDGSSHLGFRGEGAAHYYDILVEHSFGNYGELLKKVSMNAIMADYLTYVASSKDNNVTGTAPDENYARELMQLFSVGLYELNDDGTKVLDSNNLPTPIYTQDDVSQMAKVFTGWALSSNHYYADSGDKDDKKNDQYANNQTYMHSFILPIRSFNEGEFHDKGVKTILGETIEAGLTPEQDIDRAIEILMANKNIGPHICRELINRLVTSNPSPEYMSDVVAVFNSTNNESGKKGDLKATIREILTHDEARNASSNTNGKVDEFMLLTTHYLSSLNIKPLPVVYIKEIEIENIYWFTPDTQYYHQVPLEAPSVFNFYSPEYIPNDASFSDTGLVAPEFELRTYNGLIAFANYIQFNLNKDRFRYEFIDDDFVSMSAWAKDKKINQTSYSGLYIDTTKFYEEFSILVDGNKNFEFNNLTDKTENADGYKNISSEGKAAIVELIEYLDTHFTGGITPQEYKDELARHLSITQESGPNVTTKKATYIVSRAIKAIIMSPSYMVIK